MRSLMSFIAEIYLRIVSDKDYNYQKRINKALKKGEEDWAMPKYISDDLKEEDYHGMKVYYINSNSNYKNVLFYIHGGYYLHQPTKYHIKMLKRIIKGGNTMLVFPLYPKAPWHTVEDSFDNMLSLFNKVQKENIGKRIILSGDSSGGGYALALAESTTTQPDELILLSPWIDITMSNEEGHQKYLKKDPKICIKKGLYAGNAWRGKYDSNDYHVSPINGDLSRLNNVTIFIGTHEFLYPDSVLLYNKLKDKGISTTLIVGEKQDHVYPAYPCREGHQAIKQIIRIINN